jgi:DNA-binding NarL/FixJ family response regulator
MKIIVIEDHKLVRDMLVLSCRSIVADAVCSVADNGEAGLALCRREQPDLIFLDLVLPDRDGLDLVPEILAAAPRAKIIALTSFADELTVHRVQRASVHGFIAKNEQPLDLLKEAIETVMRGGQYFSPVVRKLNAALRSNPASFDKVLSEHEQRLLGLFGEGLSNEAVAARVGLSANTVKVHRRNILGKLNLHSTPELMHYALEKGFTRVGLNRNESRRAPP